VALFITRTAELALKSLPEAARDKALAMSKWIYTNHSDVPLTPLAGFEGREYCLFEAKGNLYHLVFDVRDFPPNLRIVATEKAAP